MASSSRARDRLENPPYNCRKLCKPRSLQLAYLAAQVDSQCYHSLPAKIQQKHFSEEERLRFRLAYQRFVLADQRVAGRRRKQSRQISPSLRSQPSQSTFPFSQASTLYLDPSDSSIPGEIMDDSLYNSFRWLDEDANLDLSLDGYHARNVNTIPKLPPRRRPSFRRTMSFNSVQIGRKPSASIRHKRFPSLSRASPAAPPSVNPVSRTSTSRPPSRGHVPRSSTSSIEPSAQYYQDPDARLKLRVFLSSPQKFDEAIQFGFPALENKENQSPEPSPAEIKLEPPEFNGTFLEDDDKSIFEDKDNPDQESEYNATGASESKPALCGGQWLPTSQPGSEFSGNREMTLKMTLTRPDLRTESPTPSPVENKLRDADLAGADGNNPRSESELDDRGPMKKIWRKLWKQKGLN